MSSKTKIVVLHMKEIIYTIIFVLLAIILGLTLFFMFGPGKNLRTSARPTSRYTAGIYRSAITLNNNSFDVEVSVSSDQIQSIHLVNLSESTAAMFPLMEPALDALASQIYLSQSLEDLTYPEDQKYTTQVLLEAIKNALKNAVPSAA